MAYDNRDSIDFGSEDIHKLFKKLFIPTLLGMLFNLAFILTDGIFVGHGVGPDGLASVNLVSPVMMLMTGIGMMFGTGSSVVAAIHLSKGNVKAARINVTQALIFASAIAIIISVVLYSCTDPILRLLGTSEELVPMTHEYLVWFVPTCILIMIQIVSEFVIRLDGSPKYAMYANIIPAVINIILDYIFIFVCHLGLKGAALATSTGTGFGAAISLYYMFRMSRSLRLYRVKRTVTSLRLGLRNVGYMVKVGFSGFLGEFAASVTTLCGNLAFGRLLGDDGISAFSAICYVSPVVFNIYYAVSSSAQPIISFNYGARLGSRVSATFHYSVGISMIFAAVITVLFWLFSPYIISVFLKEGSNAFNLASSGLRLFSIGFIITAFNISAIGYFQSTERNIVSTVLMLLRGVILLVITFSILPHLFGEYGLWLSAPVAEAFTAFAAIVFLSVGHRASSSDQSEC